MVVAAQLDTLVQMETAVLVTLDLTTQTLANLHAQHAQPVNTLRQEVPLAQFALPDNLQAQDPPAAIHAKQDNIHQAEDNATLVVQDTIHMLGPQAAHNVQPVLIKDLKGHLHVCHVLQELIHLLQEQTV